MNISPTEGNLVGHIIGDGMLFHNKIGYCNTELQLVIQFRRIFIQWYTSQYGNLPLLSFGKITKAEGKKDTHRMAYRCCFSNGTAVDYFKKTYGNCFSSNFTDVPHAIKESSLETKANFIRALFDDDGTVAPCGIVKLTQKSPSLIYGVGELLLEFNIESKIKKYREEWYLYIVGCSNKEKYYRLIGFDHPKKHCKLASWVGTKHRNMGVHGLFLKYKDAFVVDWEGGLSYKSLMLKYGILSCATVANWCKRLNLTRRYSYLLLRKCQRCEHEWMPQKLESNKCPKCKSLKFKVIETFIR